MANRDTIARKVLLVSPLPPPASGIGSWTAGVVAEAAGRTTPEIIVVDTAVRWRSALNMSPAVRLSGGSAQALRDVCRVWSAIVRHKPDVLHLNTSGSYATPKDIMILRLVRRFRIGTAIHYHIGRLPEIIRGNTLEWKLIGKAMRAANRVVVLTKESEICLKAAAKDIDVVTMPNPVDIARTASLAAGTTGGNGSRPLHIAFAGHVTEAKGVGNLVAACAKIPADGIVLDIVGPVEKRYREQLESIAEERDGGRWLTFHGEVDHSSAVRHLAAADVLALPSLTEGFPYVVAEAMACGVPIVATNVGAIPDMLADGSAQACGLCVEPGDIGGLTNALATILGDPDGRQRMGTCGRRRAEQYSLPNVFVQLEALWNSLVLR